MLQQFIAPAVSFGLSAAVIPGPLIAYLVNTTLTQGWRRALLVLLAPLITDAPIIFLMTFMLGQLPAAALRLIQAGGGVLLLFIAWGAYKQYRADALKMFQDAPKRNEEYSARRVLLTAILMNFLSPGPWLFWGTVNGPLLLRALELSPGHALAFLLSFYGVFLLGLAGWIAVFHQARRVRLERLRFVLLATVLLLLWFGIGLVMAAVSLERYQPLVVALVIALEALRRRGAQRSSSTAPGESVPC